jgi:hypothetical protein
MTDFSTSRKHSMDYVTVDGVILRTGYSNKRDWYLVCIRELLDNAADFLWEFYKGSNNAAIIVEIFKDTELFHLKVRNSNDNDVPVFSGSGLTAIFDYEGRYGSKQDIHVISRGMLGDALKQILAFGYVLLHAKDDGTNFIDKQWKQPLIIRHNKIEQKYVLEVDKANQNITAKQIKKRELVDIGTDTEIEVALPIIDDEIRDNLDRLCIEEYCRKYPLFTTDISFKFSITDNVSITTENKNNRNKIIFESSSSSSSSSSSVTDQKKNKELNIITKGLLAALTSGPPRAKVRIDFPALHPISAEKWNKTDSIHSYKPEEFARRVLNLRNREKPVYEVLHRIREGTNIKRTEDHKISVGRLVSLPKEDLGKMMKTYYVQLKDALSPPTKISLPHHTNNKKRRMNILKSRVASLYDIDNDKQAAYKSVHGYYNDSIIQYPFFIEIFAIPFKHPDKAKTVFVGAVNYSISPKENGTIFEGKYPWFDEKDRYHYTEDILGVLREHKFCLEYNQAKLPCIIIANLVTPKRDPQGQDKSRIDTRPFTKAIIELVGKMAAGIQTYHAAGWKFRDQFDRSTAKKHDINIGKKTKVADLLRDFLVENRGLSITTTT